MADEQRQDWDEGRRLREQELRRYLRAQGVDPPQRCHVCRAALEVYRDRQRTLVVRCAGRCGRQDGRSALVHLRAAGAGALPGFEGL